MAYAFLLFWPANVMPVWLMVTLMQLFIPFKLFLSMYFNKLQYYPKHMLAAGGILVAVAINLVNLKDRGTTEVTTPVKKKYRMALLSTRSCSSVLS